MSQSNHNDVMTLALASEATLGECLLWSAAMPRWCWTDIEAATVHAWSPESGAMQSVKLPDRLGSFAHCQSGRTLLGLAKRLCFADGLFGPNAKLDELVSVEPDEPRTRINDGRIDRRGFFVFGTMNEATDAHSIGHFYQYSMHYGLRRLALPAVAIANSICFSVDGKTMYFADTLTRRIQQCDYDAETARVDNIRLFAEVNEPNAYPDGSVVDQEGCLWNAEWGAGRVVQYSPSGKLIRSIRLPVKNPTCPAFGGKYLSQLMVTSARKEMSSEELLAMPLAGGLFCLNMHAPIGILDTLFDDSPIAAT